jgi:hypothetical protein
MSRPERQLLRTRAEPVLASSAVLPTQKAALLANTEFVEVAQRIRTPTGVLKMVLLTIVV